MESAAKLSAAKRKELDAQAKDIQDKLAKVDEHVKKGEFDDAKVLAARTFRDVWELEQQYKK
jgi:BMFP domain-containing protein YqiC